MSNRSTFTLDDEAYHFLTTHGGDNRSAYINRLLKREKRKILEDAVLKANKEEAEDTAYQVELSEWDSTLLDGLGTPIHESK